MRAQAHAQVLDVVQGLAAELGAGHEDSTVIVGLNGLRLPRASAWPRLTQETE
ncbi:hypothetical protein ACFU3J_07690 [Streptomyces sp. NPDC057411]|uniref:hypothetical protein n=1 Tax=unclassified Streptomyces TaxID=2593676 RepID=UPI00362C1DBB